ncbi:hypothetical protein HPB52_017323 [Rhipicephalus sanguineus]|uniref:Uncharacterized protein n=1 Tax=Rhipicephalus sanguineus TaxID=34632 RepID=A0A9D4SNN5_RHISA|nr:hypothetical protein HPB52_017323 [Rhipicephalus sanguineus]
MSTSLLNTQVVANVRQEAADGVARRGACAQRSDVISARPTLGEAAAAASAAWVCVDHFDASCIERTTSYTDPRTGRVIEVALPVPRLRPGSVPTIFPGCPSYLSVSDHNTRETPDAKRSRKEASQLAHAVEESLASYEAEQERDRFSSLEELKARLQVVSVSPKGSSSREERARVKRSQPR